MQIFTVHAAKTHLSKLIDAALAGEEIVIARGNKPAVRLVAVPQGNFRIGILQDVLKGPVPDFQALEEDDLQLWEGDGQA